MPGVDVAQDAAVRLERRQDGGGVALRRRQSSELTLTELARAIEENLTRFTGSVPFADDRTTVLIRRDYQPSSAVGP